MTGVEVTLTGGVGERSGIKPGDRILSINGHEIRDPIDYRYHEEGSTLTIRIEKKGGGIRNIEIKKEEGEGLGLDLARIDIKRCRNHCIFCFMDQMPEGLRRSLYIKDDDYRLSFLFGNYITLTNLTGTEKERIITQRLSPLYISIHTTDPQLRRYILGNMKAPDVMEDIRDLAENRIRMHTQIVVVPGINDGKHLERTISDLSSLYPNVSSIAVVPVGVTRCRDRLMPIPAFTKRGAEDLLDIVHSWQAKFRKAFGANLVFGADELYIKGKCEFPPIMDYEDLPQVENGIGMVPYFLNRFGRLRKRLKMADKIRGVGIVTGVDFSKYLRKLLKDIGPGLRIISVPNSFFGKEVTVTGLLTGSDIRRKIGGLRGIRTLIIPSVAINDDGLFLDDIHIDEIKSSCNIPIRVIEPDPEALIEELEALC
ncbi:MAG TPA: DUF512 domain-containing protein [Nitrospiria bacterium]|nr:DUF512 domain-containing protein [Nitrospiria bacterium]